VDRIILHRELFDEVKRDFRIEESPWTAKDNGRICDNVDA